jgi:hypothetical protein
MPAFVVILLSLTIVAAPPPLTDDQAAQLATATDRSATFDEAALYPLLINAAAWPDDAPLPAGALVPDYAALAADPEAHRGGLFLIEGRLAAVPRPFGTLSRPGPWDATLRQWPLLTDDGTVALVYLLDSPPPADLPPAGSRVRAAARFYKVWSSEDLGGRQRDYQTFVGRSATWETRPDGWMIFMPLLGAVLVLLVVYVLLRQTLGRRRATQPAVSRQDMARQAPPARSAGYDPALPRDPAEAMQRLAEQSQTDPESDRDAPR